MLTVLLADLHLGLFGRLSWWLLVPLLVYWAVVVVLLIYDNREPSSTLIWLFVLVFLPVVGLVFFLFFGRDWKVITARRHWAEGYVAAVKAKMRPIYERNAASPGTLRRARTPTPRRPTSRPPSAATTARGRCPPTASRSSPPGPRSSPASSATWPPPRRSSTWSTSSGSRTSSPRGSPQILLDRLAAGVEVRILYDYIGSISFKKDELKKLAAAGAQVSADVKYLFKLNYRNHRKIVVIDGVIGYTGGMNMGQEYIDGGKRFASWRDTHLRITGQAVAELQKLFALRWFEDEHEDLLDDRHLPPAEAATPTGRCSRSSWRTRSKTPGRPAAAPT